jgi:hypothetical protein
VGSWKLVGEFTEIESGKRAVRPKLVEAVKAAKKHKATLVIAMGIGARWNLNGTRADFATIV